jgi:hypothetical protein
MGDFLGPKGDEPSPRAWGWREPKREQAWSSRMTGAWLGWCEVARMVREMAGPGPDHTPRTPKGAGCYQGVEVVPRGGIEPPTRGFSGENHSRNALVTIRNSLFSKETDRKQTQSNVTGFPGL